MSEKILIVDDYEVNRHALKKLLGREGHTLLEAADGEAAVVLANRERPDLILLDIVMPKKDGYQVIAELKQSEATRDIPVIFLTARAETADKIKGLKLGGIDYVTKPFHSQEVLARVRNQLQIRTLTKSLLAANAELQEKNARIQEDLLAAAGIQQSLLPAEAPSLPGVEVAWKFVPCGAIGGDMLNVLRLSEDEMGLYVFDVSGHGVPAALVTVSVSQVLVPHTGAMLKERISNPPYYRLVPPAKIMERLEREFPLSRFGRFFTIAYLTLNARTGALRYTRAGHPPPLLLRADRSLETLEAGGTIIGAGAGLPFTEGNTALRVGDKLILYTDGILEYPNRAGEFFGAARFQESLQKFSDRPIRPMLEALLETLMEFGDRGDPTDDLTLLGLEYKGA